MKEPITCRLTIRFFGEEERCFGPGVACLLRNIQQSGSIRKAAQSMGMAYSKAWNILNRSEEMLGFPLLVRTAGGKTGGGARLTPEGTAYLEQYETFCAKVNAFAQNTYLEMFAGEASGEKE